MGLPPPVPWAPVPPRQADAPPGAPIGGPALTEADLAMVVDLARRHAGIVIAEGKRSMIQGRLARHAKRLGLPDAQSFCDQLRHGPDAQTIERLVNALTTNHTSFFRERHHFDHLDQALPALVQEAAGPVRLWSAACSSGEEPYSIAATVRQALGQAVPGDLRILATDIDSEVLAAAEAGKFAEAALAGLAPAQRQLLGGQAGDGVVVDPRLRAMVAFRRLNLIGPWPMRGRFDAIFCRNVLIYFDQATKTQLIDRLVGILRPGGFLYLGHADAPARPHPALDLVGRSIWRRLA